MEQRPVLNSAVAVTLISSTRHSVQINSSPVLVSTTPQLSETLNDTRSSVWNDRQAGTGAGHAACLFIGPLGARHLGRDVRSCRAGFSVTEHPVSLNMHRRGLAQAHDRRRERAVIYVMKHNAAAGDRSGLHVAVCAVRELHTSNEHRACRVAELFSTVVQRRQRRRRRDEIETCAPNGAISAATIGVRVDSTM